MPKTLWLAIGFAVIHLLSKHMKFLKTMPRSRLLSVAGGIAVAYVFLRTLPELGEYQLGSARLQIESEIYLFAMIGLVLFYGLERLVSNSKRKTVAEGTSNGVFWLHMASFALYNGLIGYLLVEGEYKSIKGLLFYFIAMSVHFISNDHGLRQTHKEVYDTKGRWLLAFAVVGGWILGKFAHVDSTVVAYLFAFLAGGVILNVMKEELPEERESNFWAFLGGLAVYSFVLFIS